MLIWVMPIYFKDTRDRLKRRREDCAKVLMNDIDYSSLIISTNTPGSCVESVWPYAVLQNSLYNL